MDTQDYMEVCIQPLDEQGADIIGALAGDLGYDSFIFEEPVLKCYIQSELYEPEAMRSLLNFYAASNPIRPEFSAGRMDAANWNSAWEQSGFTPIVVGQYTVLAEGGTATTPNSIFLRPQMAFGTGHHSTTRMMMEQLIALGEQIRQMSVMDLGCGTAVLAILASKLGAARVSAIDIDAVAVRSALENLALNACSFPVSCGDASSLEPLGYDLILANIHKNIIISDLPRYSAALRSGGRLFVSGFYSEDLQDIVQAAKKWGFCLTYSLVSEDNWAFAAFGTA